MTKNSPRLRVGVVLIKGNEILLAYHSYKNESYWVLPGGALEKNETLTECAIREVREETNLEIKVRDLLFVDEAVSKDQSLHWIQIVFWGEITGGELNSKPKGLFQGAKFIDIDELVRINFYPKIIAEEIKRAYQTNSEIKPKFVQREFIPIS